MAMDFVKGALAAVSGQTSLNDSDQDSVDLAMTRDLDEKFQKAEKDRLVYEPTWFTNISFFYGRQWVEFDQSTRMLQPIRLDWWKAPTVINLIKPTVLTMWAKVVDKQPSARTQPQDGTPESEQAARACDKLLIYQWPRMQKDVVTRRAAMWAILTGTGIIKTYWDGDIGTVLPPDPETGEPVLSDSGKPVRLGDTACQAISPFEFYPEPLAEEIDTMGWCFHVKVRPKSYVKAKYGKDVEESALPPGALAASQLIGLVDPAFQAEKRGVVVKEYWERPNEEYPKGRYVVYAGQRVLYTGDNPYEKKPIPFDTMTAIPSVGRFWGTTTVDDLIEIQRNYNKARQQAITIRNTMSKPQWLEPEGTVTDGFEITDQPGQRIRYTPGPMGAKPERIAGSEVPASFWTDLTHSQQEIYEVSGQHEISRGVGMAGIRTGVAIGYLIEQDDLRLGPTVQSHERLIEKMESATLSLCKQFYNEPRVINVVGEDSTVEAHEFLGTSIPDDPRVNIQTGNALPRSRAARQQFVQGLWQSGLIEDKNTALKLLEFGTFEGLFDAIKKAERQAERENEKMSNPQMDPLTAQPAVVAVEDWHDHPTHIKTHNGYRTGEEFEGWDVTRKQAMAQHVAQHGQFLAQQQQVAMVQTATASAAQRGQPPGPSDFEQQHADLHASQEFEAQPHVHDAPVKPAGMQDAAATTRRYMGG